MQDFFHQPYDPNCMIDMFERCKYHAIGRPMVDFFPWHVAGSQPDLRTSRSRESQHSPPQILPDNQLGMEQTPTPSQKRYRSKTPQEVQEPQQPNQVKTTAAKTKPKAKKPQEEEPNEPVETEETATASTGPIKKVPVPKKTAKAKAAPADKPPVHPKGSSDVKNPDKFKGKEKAKVDPSKEKENKEPDKSKEKEKAKTDKSKGKEKENKETSKTDKPKKKEKANKSKEKENKDTDKSKEKEKEKEKAKKSKHVEAAGETPDAVAALRRASTEEVNDKEAKRKAYKARKQRFYNSLNSDGLSFFFSAF